MGLIRWPDIARTPIPDTSLARDIMLANCPTLTRHTSLQEAGRRLNITGMDRLPVVDGDGELIGVFTQDTLKEQVPMGNGNLSRPDGEQTHEPPVRQTFTVYPGMEVYTSDGVLIGLIDRLFLVSGTISEFLISTNESATGHKLLNTGNIDKLVKETVILSVSREAFVELPDVDLDGFESREH